MDPMIPVAIPAGHGPVRSVTDSNAEFRRQLRLRRQQTDRSASGCGRETEFVRKSFPEQLKGIADEQSLVVHRRVQLCLHEWSCWLCVLRAVWSESLWTGWVPGSRSVWGSRNDARFRSDAAGWNTDAAGSRFRLLRVRWLLNVARNSDIVEACSWRL